MICLHEDKLVLTFFKVLSPLIASIGKYIKYSESLKFSNEQPFTQILYKLLLDSITQFKIVLLFNVFFIHKLILLKWK